MSGFETRFRQEFRANATKLGMDSSEFEVVFPEDRVTNAWKGASAFVSCYAEWPDYMKLAARDNPAEFMRWWNPQAQGKCSVS